MTGVSRLKVGEVIGGLAFSRYAHLYPVRIGALGLSKAEQRAMKAGRSAAPESAG